MSSNRADELKKQQEMVQHYHRENAKKANEDRIKYQSDPSSSRNENSREAASNNKGKGKGK